MDFENKDTPEKFVEHFNSDTYTDEERAHMRQNKDLDAAIRRYST